MIRRNKRTAKSKKNKKASISCKKFRENGKIKEPRKTRKSKKNKKASASRSKSGGGWENKKVNANVSVIIVLV